MPRKRLIDITDQLTDEGIKKLSIGQIMVFDYEGSKTYFKITQKRNGTVRGKFVDTFDPEEVGIKEKKTGKILV